MSKSDRFIASATPEEVERFATKTRRTATGCLEWTGTRLPKGYGQFRLGGRRGIAVQTHRLAWALVNGQIPENIWVLHRCDNPPCVEPSHLFLGSAAENSADMTAKGRQASFKLTKSRAAQIRYLHARDGGTYKEIALRFGVHESLVGLILRRQVWTTATVLDVLSESLP